jgi:hypothetical protein
LIYYLLPYLLDLSMNQIPESIDFYENWAGNPDFCIPGTGCVCFGDGSLGGAFDD